MIFKVVKKKSWEWHKWFAWYPVAIVITKYEAHIVWFENVLRKKNEDNCYSYKFIEKDSKRKGFTYDMEN